jgi:uncharacterized protein (DUF58 family)
MRHLPGFLLALLLAAAATGRAETNVAGRYLSGGGSDVRMLLTVEKPPPAAFIVLQKIPPGTKMTSASPAPSGFQQDGATVKWLFKRPRPGSMILSMQLTRQVPEDQLEGEISYRHPRNGSLVVRKISN